MLNFIPLSFFSGHRTLFVGVRMPMGRESHRHHRPHSSKHRRRSEKMRAESVAQEDGNTESTLASHGESNNSLGNK